MIYLDKSEYIGEWKRGKMYGIGEQTFVNGCKYIGRFKVDQRHGYGEET
jgi:hypothetical protein